MERVQFQLLTDLFKKVIVVITVIRLLANDKDHIEGLQDRVVAHIVHGVLPEASLVSGGQRDIVLSNVLSLEDRGVLTL